jgi:hypothetical protein
MKEHLYVKRELATMNESEQSAYVIRVGNFLIINTLTFPDIPTDGTVMKADGILLGDYYSVRDVSDENMGLYKAKQLAIIENMEKDYNNVDEVANGDKTIIVKAGMNYSSDNTSRVGVPADFSNLKYSLSTTPNQIKIEWKADDNSYGTLTFTSTETNLALVQTGLFQLKLTIGTVDVLIDIATKASVEVKNLIGGTDVKSRAVKFNTNGMNLLAVLQIIGVPKALV